MLDPLEFKVLKFVQTQKLLSKGESVLVALSGGIDSVSLLHVLLQLREIYRLRVCAAHLNHMLRATADRDEAFVSDLCAKLKVELCVERIDVAKFCEENKLGIEEGARKLRYQFLDNAKRKLQCDVIALAHNLNDLVETMLHRIVRGTGPLGLVAMKPRFQDKIRPFIYIERSEIEEYAKRKNLSFVEDETNYDVRYTRNYIRHVVIPALRRINPSIEKALLQLHVSNMLIERHVEEFLRKQRLVRFRDRTIFSSRKLSDFELVELLRSCVKEFGEQLEFEHVQQLLERAHSPSWKIELAKGLWLEKGFDLFCVEREHDVLESLKIEECGLYDFNGWCFKLNDRIESDQYIFVKLPILVRVRKPGDRVSSKKLKDLMIEARIPSFLRDEMPVVEENGIILWVPYVYVDKRLNERLKNDDFLVLNLLENPFRVILELRKEEE
ncbi:MAG: tRNA lysidine(34) synthetase TilS [Pseudothermotoga sp.]|nr:tRNA lysidine(34) synthetase TilS [Pseudothermotoga sp.]